MSALKDFPDEDQDKIWDAIEELKKNPRPYKHKKLDPPKSKFNQQAHYRLKIPPYRVFYDIYDKTQSVYLIHVARRNEKTYK